MKSRCPRHELAGGSARTRRSSDLNFWSRPSRTPRMLAKRNRKSVRRRRCPQAWKLRSPDNEQMEFLGDAVLSFVVSQELFRRFPEYQEGELSKLRAHIVSARRLLRPAANCRSASICTLAAARSAAAAATRAPCWSTLSKPSSQPCFSTPVSRLRSRFILQHILEPELAEVHKHGSEPASRHGLQVGFAGGGARQRTPAGSLRHGQGGGPGSSQDVHH